MIKVDQYRMRGDQCEKEAALTLNLEIRAELERIAEYWRELAHMRERYLENRLGAPASRQAASRLEMA